MLLFWVVASDVSEASARFTGGWRRATHLARPMREKGQPSPLLAPTGLNFLTVNSCFSQSPAMFLSSSAPEHV